MDSNTSFTSLLTLDNESSSTQVNPNLERFGGLPSSFRETMQHVAEDQINSIKRNLKLSRRDCDIYTWNFSTWCFNTEVRHTTQPLRLNPKQRVFFEDSKLVSRMIFDMQFQTGYYWEEIKHSENYKKFCTYLMMRWVKLLLSVILTIGFVYLLSKMIKINPKYTESQQKIMDIWIKLAMYACFIPVLIYMYFLFGRSEERFLKFFKSLYTVRKRNLGQTLNFYNEKKLHPQGLACFFDEVGLNLIIGRRESIAYYEETYKGLNDDERSALTGELFVR
jgi:hypothetical protein